MPRRRARTASCRLNRQAASISDPFLKKALGLAVDGIETDKIRDIMELEIEIFEQKCRSRGKGLRSRGRIRSDNRNHRRGAGADPGDEKPGGHR